MTVRERFTRFLHNKPLKHKLYVIIFESDTPAGKMFDVALIVCIALSILLAIPRKSARNSFLAFNSVYYIRISVYGFLYFRIRYAHLLFTTTQEVHFQLLRHYRPIGNPTAISCLFPAGSTLSTGYPGIPYYSGVSYIQAFHFLDGRRTIAHFTQREQ